MSGCPRCGAALPADERRRRMFDAIARVIAHEARAQPLLPAPGRQPREAEAWYRSALALAGTLHMRPLAARCRLGLGTLAGDAAEIAAGMFRQMAMVEWAEEAKARLEQPRPV